MSNLKACEASETARLAMEKGHNCCEAVLIACNQVWNMDLNEDTLAAATMFGEGMESGCTCGALVGMVMASGILQRRNAHPLGKKLSNKLSERFKREFGSTCCRVIKKNRPMMQRIGRRACIDLTARATIMLVEEWEGIKSE